MQYQKEEVRSRIIKVATAEFYAVGYAATSMLQISTKARVPIGNLYRYFPSKSALFDEIVGDAYRAVTEYIVRAYEAERAVAESGEESALTTAERIAVALSGTIEEYEQPIYILAKKSEGSKYSTFTKEVAELVRDMCKKGLYGDNLAKSDELLCSIIADNLTYGIARVFLDCPAEERVLQIKKLFVFYFDRVEERLR